jgi:hypothetical protein
MALRPTAGLPNRRETLPRMYRYRSLSSPPGLPPARNHGRISGSDDENQLAFDLDFARFVTCPDVSFKKIIDHDFSCDRFSTV